MNLFHVTGGAAANIIRGNVSFENIDISTHHSDGSGYILDQMSDGAAFINNIGFHNGGSCIRLTNSTGALIVNNTCWRNGLDPRSTSTHGTGAAVAAARGLEEADERSTPRTEAVEGG